MKTEIIVLVFVVVAMQLSECYKLPSRKVVEAKKLKAEQRLQEHLLRTEEHQQRYQTLRESEQDRLLNVPSVAEMLPTISSTSTRDLRAHTKAMQKRSEAALKEALQEIQQEEEKKAVLESRWRNAKEQVRLAKQKQQALDRATLQLAQTVANKVDAALEEVVHLRTLRHQIDTATEKVRAHQHSKAQDLTVEADPSQAEAGATSSQDLKASGRKRPLMWPIYLYAAVNLVLAMVRITARCRA